MYVGPHLEDVISLTPDIKCCGSIRFRPDSTFEAADETSGRDFRGRTVDLVGAVFLQLTTRRAHRFTTNDMYDPTTRK